MNDQNERNEKLNRLFAVVGVIALIILLAWLAVQVVRFMPVAFSSLANVFEANQRDLRDNLEDDEDNVVVVPDEEETEESVADESDEETIAEETTDYETEEETTDYNTGAGSQSTSDQVYYRTVATYKVPTSDPNGYTDLEVKFIGVGRMTSSERFLLGEELEEGETGAMQFQVKNIGSKTSDKWHFVAELPDNETMTSRVQLPLKPVETATLTIVFDTEDDGYDYVGVKVLGGDDSNLNNNHFRSRIYVK